MTATSLSRLHRAFIAPLRDPRRFGLYAGTFLGMLGYDLLMLFFSYRLAADSAQALITFWGAYFVFSGLLLFPALCWFQAAAPRRRTQVLFIALMIAGMALFWLWRGHTILLAGANTLVSIPFWIAYHMVLAASSSDENRAAEICVAYLVIALGGAAGFLVGGAAMGFLPESAVMGTGFATMALGGVLLTLLLPPPDGREPFLPAIAAALRRAGPAEIATIGAGGINVFSGFLLPAFLARSGIGTLAAGLTMALRIGSGFVVTPLAGRLAAHTNLHGARAGVALYAAAWLALLLPLPFVLRLSLALVFWAASTQFYNSAMDDGWYSRKTATAIAAREIWLSIGRLVFLAPAALWVFAAPATYPLLALGFTALLGLALLGAGRRHATENAGT